MPLVDYSDSEASEPEPDSAQEKRAQPSEKGAKPSFGTVSASDLPPLPESFHDLYASHARISGHDDPSLHGGRQRQTPHVEGNWPTHVYIECKYLKYQHVDCRGSLCTYTHMWRVTVCRRCGTFSRYIEWYQRRTWSECAEGPETA